MTAPDQSVSMGRRVIGQGGLLAAGFTLAQAAGFLRNALLGHWLSQGDFGIAAAITLSLQMLEVISDVAADRLLVQAEDGESERLQATLQAVGLLRGLASAAVLYFAAPVIATFFAIPEAQPALELAALVPALRGLMHLDARRYQRELRNTPQVMVEVAPQLAALLATLPVLMLQPGFWAALWVALIQAAVAAAASHLVAERRWTLALDRACLARLLAFSWPIWLSAFPLLAVYHGDRIIVGRALGMESLAVFSAAFMVAMVPGLIAARVGNALMLPLLAGAATGGPAFRQRFAGLLEATTLAASLYLVGFVLAGGAVLALAFGPAYAGQEALMGWLAAMWALRMVQAVPGMAMMALGTTRPLLVAGLIRALALPAVVAVVANGGGLAVVAAVGVAGELASLGYVAWRAGRARNGLTGDHIWPVTVLAMAGLAAVVIVYLMGDAPLPLRLAAAAAGLAGAGLAVAAALPGLRRLLIDRVGIGSARLSAGH